MASTLLSSVMSGSSSGGGLTFPSAPVFQGTISIKNGSTTIYNDASSSFYTSLETSHTSSGFEMATYSQAANTTEQTIVDVSTSGVLTNIMSCSLSGAGDITIRITIDGQETAITTTVQNTRKVLMGGFTSNQPTATTGNLGNTIGGYNDLGFLSDPTAREFQMLTPIQVIQKGIVGMLFKESLKVTIQSSVSLTAGSAGNKCVVGYFASIPEGL